MFRYLKISVLEILDLCVQWPFDSCSKGADLNSVQWVQGAVRKLCNHTLVEKRLRFFTVLQLLQVTTRFPFGTLTLKWSTVPGPVAPVWPKNRASRSSSKFITRDESFCISVSILPQSPSYLIIFRNIGKLQLSLECKQCFHLIVINNVVGGIVLWVSCKLCCTLETQFSIDAIASD